MIKLTFKNVSTIAKALVAAVAGPDKDPRFTEARADAFVQFTIEHDRARIGGMITSLRRELDDLERNLSDGRQLFGGSNITSKAAELDAVVNTFVGKTELVGKLSDLLAEKPELE